jgi:hypothetical protein
MPDCGRGNRNSCFIYISMGWMWDPWVVGRLKKAGRSSLLRFVFCFGLVWPSSPSDSGFEVVNLGKSKVEK